MVFICKAIHLYQFHKCNTYLCYNISTLILIIMSNVNCWQLQLFKRMHETWLDIKAVISLSICIYFWDKSFSSLKNVFEYNNLFWQKHFLFVEWLPTYRLFSSLLECVRKITDGLWTRSRNGNTVKYFNFSVKYSLSVNLMTNNAAVTPKHLG